MAAASAQRIARRRPRVRRTARRGVVVTYALAAGAIATATKRAPEQASRRGSPSSRATRSPASTMRGARYDGPVYFVPSDAMVGIDAAQALGIHGEDDLFGGVVPHRFVATKVITHPLFDVQAHAPEGWVPEFPQAVAGSVLDGFSAFAREDARRAGARRCSNADRCASSGRWASAVVGNTWSRRATNSPTCSATIDAEEFSTARRGRRGEPRRRDDLRRRPGTRGRSSRQLLRHAAAHDEQPGIGGVRRLRPVRRARRFRRVAALSRWRSRPACDRAGPRVRCGRARMLPGLLRFAAQLRRDAGHRRAWTAALGRARAIVADRRRERRRGRSARSVPRRPRTGVGARRFRRDLRREPAAAGGRGRLFSRRRRARRARSPSTAGSNPMPTHDELVDIPVGDQHIAGTLVAPRTLDPRRPVRARLGRQPATVRRAGTHAGGAGLRLPHVRPARPRANAVAVRDRHRARTTCATSWPPTTCSRRIRSVDTTRMAVVGSSYGGYLAAILTSHAVGEVARACVRRRCTRTATGSWRSGA